MIVETKSTRGDTLLLTPSKACRIHQFGGPEVISLEDMVPPEPGKGEVLVRVRAAGVGPWDAWVRAGKSALPQPLPLTLGSDIAGVVQAVGPGVTGLAPGDAVFGVTNPHFTGGYADYAVATAAMLAKKPAALSDIDAASVPVVTVTAWQALFEEARLTAGQSVLIHGAAGNVGAFAVHSPAGRACASMAPPAARTWAMSAASARARCSTAAPTGSRRTFRRWMQ
jgi:NADPH:quinone reductase-like Zn-dependent oxidoreductase